VSTSNLRRDRRICLRGRKGVLQKDGKNVGKGRASTQRSPQKHAGRASRAYIQSRATGKKKAGRGYPVVMPKLLHCEGG